MSFNGKPIPSSQLQTSHRLHTPLSAPTSTTTAYVVLSLVLIYYILHYLDYTNLPLSELLWNAAVYMTPSNLVATLDKDFAKSILPEAEGDNAGFDPKGHAGKSNALRRILGLETGGLIHVVQQTRTLSNLGGILKTRPTNSPPGLGNWDNSCYQNSVLQGLSSLDSLPIFLEYSGEVDTRSSTRKALRDLAARLNDADNVGKTFWTPAKLKNMSSWQQQDAQEYFSKVLDEVEKDIARDMRKSPRLFGLEDLSAPNDEVQNVSTKHNLSDVQSPISASRISHLPNRKTAVMTHNPLEGLLAQRVGCQQCGYVEGLSLVPFNCLTVPLGKEWLYDLRACLDDFTALEPINGVECAKCTLLQAERQMVQILETLRPSCGDDREANVSQTILALCKSVGERLKAVREALDDQDFSENALKKCQVGPKNRISTTKSRQAVIARPPKALTIHVNRSEFNEATGMQSKNYANVRFPMKFGLGPWCLGHLEEDTENWNTDPSKSMLPDLSLGDEDNTLEQRPQYELRAVVTHYGKHENGHYICYRRSPQKVKKLHAVDTISKEPPSWWRLSDEDVTEVSEEKVLAQGGVFMLFYEQIQFPLPTPSALAQEQIIEEKVAPPLNAPLKNEEREQEANESTKAIESQSNSFEDVVAITDAPPLRETQSPVPQNREEELVGEHGSQDGFIPPSSPTTETPSRSTPPNDLSEKFSPELQAHTDQPIFNLPDQSSHPPLSQPAIFPPASQSPETDSQHTALQKPITPRSGRRSASRAGRAMESVAGFVQAN